MEAEQDHAIGGLIARLYKPLPLSMTVTGAVKYGADGEWRIPRPYGNPLPDQATLVRLGRIYFTGPQGTGIFTTSGGFGAITLPYVIQRWFYHAGPHYLITKEFTNTPALGISLVFYTVNGNGGGVAERWRYPIEEAPGWYTAMVSTWNDRWIVMIQIHDKAIRMTTLDPKTGERVAFFEMVHVFGKPNAIAMGTHGIYTQHTYYCSPGFPTCSAIVRWDFVTGRPPKAK
jgi:hypothetical protein